MGGRYEEAAEIYTESAETDPAAAVALARCLRAQGKSKQAVEKLSPLADGQAAVLAELARLALERGDHAEAKARADEAVGLDDKELMAVWINAEVDRVSGRLDDAERKYVRLIRHYNATDIEQAESLRWIGLAAARYARWNRRHQRRLAGSAWRARCPSRSATSGKS